MQILGYPMFCGSKNWGESPNKLLAKV